MYDFLYVQISYSNAINGSGFLHNYDKTCAGAPNNAIRF